VKTYKTIYPQLAVHMWMDSEIALCWVHANRQVDVFVDNCVQKIKELEAQWRHIPSAQNSADVTSRGM
jgi:hypothetical protein